MYCYLISVRTKRSDVVDFTGFVFVLIHLFDLFIHLFTFFFFFLFSSPKIKGCFNEHMGKLFVLLVCQQMGGQDFHWYVYVDPVDCLASIFLYSLLFIYLLTNLSTFYLIFFNFLGFDLIFFSFVFLFTFFPLAASIITKKIC